MLVENILPKYYIITMSGLITDIEVLSILVKLRDPEVHSHIEALGVPWAVLTTKWFVCLFAEVLPTEVSHVIYSICKLYFMFYYRQCSAYGIVYSMKDPRYYFAWL